MENNTPSNKIPITLLTGFLGSGKTTLLNHLLKAPEFRDTAVLINEFGAIALDHHLVTTVQESTVVLDGGCICCTVRGELAVALQTLFWQRHDKTIPEFQRVIIETTGLADPAPIVHELLSHPMIRHRYRLTGVITCVDSIFGEEQLNRQPESRKQAAVADRLLVTKTDLAPTEQISSLIARLAALNPSAHIHAIKQGIVDPQVIFDTETEYDPLNKSVDVRKWLKAETYRQVRVRPGAVMNQKPMSLFDDINRHDDHIEAFCLIFDHPLPMHGLTTALHMLCTLRGDRLLRLKGIINAEGEHRPYIVHGVQHMLFPITTLETWPDASRETRLVFIVRDMDREFIVQTLNNFVNAASDTWKSRVES